VKNVKSMRSLLLLLIFMNLFSYVLKNVSRHLEVQHFLYFQVKVFWSDDEINAVIKDAHEGLGESMQSKSQQSHIGITSLIWELSIRFYWQTYLLGLSMLLDFCASF